MVEVWSECSWSQGVRLDFRANIPSGSPAHNRNCARAIPVAACKTHKHTSHHSHSTRRWVHIFTTMPHCKLAYLWKGPGKQLSGLNDSSEQLTYLNGGQPGGQCMTRFSISAADSGVSPKGPCLLWSSYRIIPNEYTSPFWVPNGGSFEMYESVSRRSSGARYNNA